MQVSRKSRQCRILLFPRRHSTKRKVLKYYIIYYIILHIYIYIYYLLSYYIILYIIVSPKVLYLHAFPKNQLFPKSNPSEKVAQKYLVRKSTSSENVFILNSFLTKKVGVPKNAFPKELPVLKKQLLSRSFALKKQLF